MTSTISLSGHEIPLIRLSDQFKIEKLLGEGGFGRVFLVVNKETQRRAALKINYSDTYLLTNEYDILESLSQIEGVPQIYGLYAFKRAGQTPNKYGLAIEMEYIEGINLEEFKKSHELDSLEMVDWIGQLLRIIWSIHQQGYIHRDIKPANIIYNSQNSKVYLVDIGLACNYIDYKSRLACRGKVGTRGFISIDTLQGLNNPENDYYGLGRTFYTLATDLFKLEELTKEQINKGVETYYHFGRNQFIRRLINSLLDYGQISKLVVPKYTIHYIRSILYPWARQGIIKLYKDLETFEMLKTLALE